MGKPSNATGRDVHDPLGGFRRVGPTRYAGPRAEFLWIGSEAGQDGWSADQRWPVIKALQQFGTFSGLRAAPQRCDLVLGQHSCRVPTFDWSHAVYRSRYVSFVHRELLDSNSRDYQRLLPWEHKLFVRYSEISTCRPG